MERREYQHLAALDRRLWWFRGLHAQMLTALGRPARRWSGARLLDAGCGTGGLLATLAERLPDARPMGLELDPEAAVIARVASGHPIAVGTVNAAPFASGSFAAILSSDVLCHRGVDQDAAIGHFHRCLAPGGVLVLNLPAYRWLFSQHDIAVDNVRRYSAGEVRHLLSAAGFTRIRTRYWNTLLFPLMVLKRKLAGSKRGASDVAAVPAPLDLLFRAVVLLEAKITASGLRLPFGGSLLATAVKP
jgi:SAM-dependent methyltransferase